MANVTDHAQIEVKSRAELRLWLKANHKTSGSIWLITWKKPSAHHVPYDDIVEEVLCFGWIDSQPRLLDTERSMVRLLPRKPKSGWALWRDAIVGRARGGLDLGLT